MDRPKPSLIPARHMTALLRDKGYRKVDVLGPLHGASRNPDYVVTVYGPGSTVLRTLRGTFEALQEQIAALPQG